MASSIGFFIDKDADARLRPIDQSAIWNIVLETRFYRVIFRERFMPSFLFVFRAGRPDDLGTDAPRRLAFRCRSLRDERHAAVFMECGIQVADAFLRLPALSGHRSSRESRGPCNERVEAYRDRAWGDIRFEHDTGKLNRWPCVRILRFDAAQSLGSQD